MGTNESKCPDPLIIHSPFHLSINIFNNDDDFLLPDSEFYFDIPGWLDNPLHLHNMIMEDASMSLSAMIHSKDTAYGMYDRNTNHVVWTYKKAAVDSTYRSVLVKWLRFCYGEEQTFSADEVPSALIVMYQLQLKCEEEMKEKIEGYMMNVAVTNIEYGRRMMYSFEIDYKDFGDTRIQNIVETLRSITKDEIMKNQNQFLRSIPGLENEENVLWQEGGRGPKFESLWLLLSGNAIPTKTLNLSSNAIGDEGMRRISMCLIENSSLTSLDLSKNNVGPVGIRAMSNALTLNNSVKYLNISFNGIEQDGAAMITEALKINTSVTSLNLSNNNIGVEGAKCVSELLKTNTSLTSLNIENNSILIYGACYIWEALQNNKTLTKLNDRNDEIMKNFIELRDQNCMMFPELRRTHEYNNTNICNQRSVNGRLRRLGFKADDQCIDALYFQSMDLYAKYSEEMSNEALIAIRRAEECEEKNSNCKELAAFYGPEEKEAVSKIRIMMAELLIESYKEEGLTLLKSYSETGNITAMCLLGLRYELGKGIRVGKDEKKGTDLYDKCIVKDSCDPKPRVFKDCSDQLTKWMKCRSIALDVMKFGDFSGYSSAQDMLLVCNALKNNTSLTTLWMGEKEIGPNGAKKIGEFLKGNHSLTELNIWNDGICAEGAISLSESLMYNTTLTTLNLGCNFIGDEGAKKISELLKVNYSLTDLNLHCNKIGDEGAIEIGESLLVNTALTVLDFGGNVYGDKGATKMVEVLMRNSTLTVLKLHRMAKCSYSMKIILCLNDH